MKEGTFQFKRRNKISCVGISFGKLVWNYICWSLAGKPKMGERKA